MLSTLTAAPPATFTAPSGAVQVVGQVLALPDEELDYAEAKIALDCAIDPSIDPDFVRAELEAMEVKARELAGPSPDDSAKLNALRMLIYESGPWERAQAVQLRSSQLEEYPGEAAVQLPCHAAGPVRVNADTVPDPG